MNWRNEAIERLKSYREYKTEYISISEQIKMLEDRSITPMHAKTDITAVKSSNTHGADEIIINNISRRRELTKRLEVIRRELAITDKALQCLTPNERKILYYFYMVHAKGHIEKLCEALFLERSRVYTLKDDTLRRFTLSCYGIVES